MTPSDTGTPVILKSSTAVDKGAAESLHYTPAKDMSALLVVKRISGSGTFAVRSTQAGPPIAVEVQATCVFNGSTTITLKATDDGKPTPPGAISYTIASKPAKGKLEFVGTGAAITTVPAKLPSATNKVVYRPPANWTGQDSFTFYADDGGTAPFGGRSNTATVKITVMKEVTIEYQVGDSADDAFALKDGDSQATTDRWLSVGMNVAGMRFRNVKVPQGATILHATLKICANPNGLKARLDGLVKSEAADNPAGFTPTGRLVWQLTTTNASVAWKWTTDAPWSADTWYDSPDIGAVVQEIVNRPGWASDNAIVLIYAPSAVMFGDERRFWSYDGDPTKAVKLSITYQPK